MSTCCCSTRRRAASRATSVLPSELSNTKSTCFPPTVTPLTPSRGPLPSRVPPYSIMASFAPRFESSPRAVNGPSSVDKTPIRIESLSAFSGGLESPLPVSLLPPPASLFTGASLHADSAMVPAIITLGTARKYLRRFLTDVSFRKREIFIDLPFVYRFYFDAAGIRSSDNEERFCVLERDLINPVSP